MKSKKWLIVTIAILAGLIIAGVSIYYFTGASADSLEANKGTKIQLVNSKGEAVKKEVPLELVLVGKKKRCTTRRIGFSVLRITKCKKVPASIDKTVTTDANGAYTISTESYRKLTKDEQKRLVKSILSDSVGRTFTDDEIKQILEYVLNDNMSESQQRDGVGRAVRAVLANSVMSVSRRDHLNTIITNKMLYWVILPNRTTEKDFEMTSAKVGPKSYIYATDKNSGKITVSFLTSEYKPEVNLPLQFSQSVVEACQELKL